MNDKIKDEPVVPQKEPEVPQKSDLAKLLPSIVALLTIIGFFFAAFFFMDQRYVHKSQLKDEPSRGKLGLDHIPIGAVVPFFLTNEEIKELAPEWVPADGNGKINGNNIPNLTGKFILGADPGSNIIPESEENAGGGLKVTLSGGTTGMEYVDHQRGKWGQAPADGNFVIDTSKDEFEISKHKHSLSVSGSIPRPPFRKLIYMIRVK